MAKKDLEKEYDKFDGFVFTQLEITCSKCNGVHGDENEDEYYFIKDAYEEGWRVTANNCYCPSCAKKYLKKK